MRTLILSGTIGLQRLLVDLFSLFLLVGTQKFLKALQAYQISSGSKMGWIKYIGRGKTVFDRIGYSVEVRPHEGFSIGGKKQKALPRTDEEGLFKNPGGVLLSHTVAQVVPSALEGLTSVCGMGTGVPPPLSPPETE